MRTAVWGAAVLFLLLCRGNALAGEAWPEASAPSSHAELTSEMSGDKEPLAVWREAVESFRFSGWLEGMYGMRIKSPHNAISRRVRLHAEAEGGVGTFYGFISARAEKNWEVYSETDAKIHEAWVEHVGTGWDVRLGRQLIIWGKADGVQITDMITPPDYTEAMTRELDEIRQPVDAVKLRFMGTELIDRDVNLELIAIPVFQKATLPKDDNPWAISASAPESVRVEQRRTKKPSASLKNTEAAARLSGYYSGLDIAISAFYTWDDFPAYHRKLHREGNTPVLTISPEHHRMTVLGFEFSRPWSDFVFRGEAACYLDRYRERKSADAGPVKKDSLKWLFGIDWTPGNDWTIAPQFINETIFAYEKDLSDSKHDTLATLNISKKLMNQTLTLSNMIYFDLNDGEFYNRSKVEYEISDGLKASAGLDIFSGTNGQYGRYSDNCQIWCKVRYSF